MFLRVFEGTSEGFQCITIQRVPENFKWVYGTLSMFKDIFRGFGHLQMRYWWPERVSGGILGSFRGLSASLRSVTGGSTGDFGGFDGVSESISDTSRVLSERYRRISGEL